MHGVFCRRKAFVHAHGVKGGRANAKFILSHWPPTMGRLESGAAPGGGNGGVGGSCANTDSPPEK